MSFNTFGKFFRFTTWGESHGPAIGCIVDGCPPNINISEQDIFFAGIHDNGQFCIITRDATKENSEIHHRQPVILPKSQINNYFNLNNNAVEFLNGIKPPELKFHEVSTEVNNPAKNDALLINPIN